MPAPPKPPQPPQPPPNPKPTSVLEPWPSSIACCSLVRTLVMVRTTSAVLEETLMLEAMAPNPPGRRPPNRGEQPECNTTPLSRASGDSRPSGPHQLFWGSWTASAPSLWVQVGISACFSAVFWSTDAAKAGAGAVTGR